MSIFNDKSLKGVADAAMKIMEASKKEENKFHNKLDKLVHGTFGDSPDEKKMKKEEKELSPKQKAIAKLDHPKHKIDAGDLAKLRAGHKPVKEEAEQLDELSTDTLKSYHTKANQDMKEKGEKLGMRAGTKKDWKRIHGMETAKSKMYSKGVNPFKEEKESCEDEVEEHEKKMHGKKGEVAKHEKEMHKEEIEQLDELSADTLKSYKNKATYGNRSAGALRGKAVDHSLKADWADAEGRKKKADKHTKQMDAYFAKSDIRKQGIQRAKTRLNNEEIEQLDEYQSKDGVYKHKGTYGGAKGAEYGDTDWDKENKDAKKLAKPASRKLGARQNFVRSTRVNESFTDMIAAYQEKGLKALAEMSKVEEEVDSETYEKEMKDQKEKFDGKKKGADYSKPPVYTVRQEEVELDEAERMKGEDPCWKDYEMVGHKMKNGKKVPNCVPKNEEYDVMDADEINGVSIDTIEEKTLTEPEAKKKEEVVKSMKKKLPSFKERYGDRAKEVMYATATKIAKEKA